LSLSLMAARAADDPGDYISQDGSVCHLEGKPNSSPANKALNRLKNRFRAPQDDEIDPEVSLAAMLAPGRDVNRFDAQRGASITGLMITVKKGGKKNCNSDATDPLDMDTHIELALFADAAETQRVIVEITPRMRKQMGADWTTDKLKAKFEGKWA